MPRIVLLSHTDDPEKVVARAGRLCYFKSGIADLQKELTRQKVLTLVNKLRESGHLSAFEHAVFSFGIEGISRVCTHQLVRHRIASYSQQSQRYVSMGDNFEYITPLTIQSNKQALRIFDAAVSVTKKAYDALLDIGISKEDARYVLPNAADTKIIVTMNARELLLFFSLRLCRRAQWEIRNMAKQMLKEARKAAPALFAQAGPECVRTKCPEGKMSCGKATAVKKELNTL